MSDLQLTEAKIISPRKDQCKKPCLSCVILGVDFYDSVQTQNILMKRCKLSTPKIKIKQNVT